MFSDSSHWFCACRDRDVRVGEGWRAQRSKSSQFAPHCHLTGLHPRCSLFWHELCRSVQPISAVHILKFIHADLFWWVDVPGRRTANSLKQWSLLAYAPQLGARLHISHTQINIVGLAANGEWILSVSSIGTRPETLSWRPHFCSRIGPLRRRKRSPHTAYWRFTMFFRRIFRDKAHI